jgi:hypothetical protein
MNDEPPGDDRDELRFAILLYVLGFMFALALLALAAAGSSSTSHNLDAREPYQLCRRAEVLKDLRHLPRPVWVVCGSTLVNRAGPWSSRSSSST